MKVGVEYIFVIIAFVAIIMLSSYGSAVVSPYQKDDLFSKQFKYEGMDNEDKSEDTKDKSEEKKDKSEEKKDNNPFAALMNMTTTTEKMTMADILPKGNLFASSSSKTPESFEGLIRLSPYELNSSDLSLDRLSKLQGGANCDSSRAAGYSNSKGPLCMDDATLQLLRTRGGNQSGAPSQIGQ
jgi:hypothetical protein